MNLRDVCCSWLRRGETARLLVRCWPKRDSRASCAKDLRELAREVDAGAGAVLLTEEALGAPGIDELLEDAGKTTRLVGPARRAVNARGHFISGCDSGAPLAPQRNAFRAAGADPFCR